MDFGKKVVELDVNDILPNRFQPRIKFNEDSINELCDSIREHGIIQPIVVRKMGDKYEIIAGERRFKASLLVGKNSIPAIITELNDKDSAEVALIENVQRRDLTPIEEAISYKKILDMGYLTQEDLANKLGKTQSTVANKLRLLNLTEDVQEALLEERISERHARSLLKLSNPAQQRKMLEKILDNRFTVRKTEEQISKLLKGEDIFEENKEKDKKIDLRIPNISNQVDEEKDIIKNNKDNEIVNPNLNIHKFEDKPIQNDYNNNDFITTIPSNIDVNLNDNKNEFNQFIPTNNDLDKNKDIKNDIFNPMYNNEENDIVPSFEDNNEEIIPVIPPMDDQNSKMEEPVVIIEEEPTMNNNNFMNINNNQNNISNSNEFNPFDMMNNVPNNDFNIPTSGIEDSPKMSSANSFQPINNNNNSYSVEEPTIITPEVNNNNNPGFLDIDKIKNEAVDINSMLQDNNDFVKPTNNVNNYNDNINNDFKPEKPILRPVENNNIEEEEPILKPGKFFDLPLDDEEPDKNEEVKLESNPFDFTINGDLSNMKLNTEGHPKFKTLDEISQFKEPVSNVTPTMINQKNENINNNPVNEFGLPIQDEYNNFNYNSNTMIKPTNTQIPPVEQNAASYMQNNMMSNQLPSNKNMNLAYDAIKECVDKIKSLGFNVNTEDFDFENMYQIMFRIEK